MVAKSYQGLEIVGDVFVSSGRQYVNVRMKNNKIKTVRFYTEKEYAKLYPDVAATADPYRKPQKEILGFTKDFVWIFEPSVGMNDEDEYFQQSTARFHKIYGWYFISSEPLPNDLPFGYNPVKLPWEVVGLSSGNLRSDADVETAIGKFFTTNSAITNYPHSVGERVEIEVKLDKIISFENNFGTGTTFRFIGVADNLPYIWITSAKRDWQIGSIFKVRGTIKDLKEFKGEFQIVLMRVNEVVK